MKKLLLLLLVFPLVFASCSDDDDDVVDQTTLVGSWEFSKSAITVETTNDVENAVKIKITKDILDFSSDRADFDKDGNYTLFEKDKDGVQTKYQDGKYTVEDGEIVLTPADDKVMTFDIAMKDNKLTLTKDETTFYQGVYEKEGSDLKVNKALSVHTAAKR